MVINEYPETLAGEETPAPARQNSLPLGVVPRAANRNIHDCRWQSYLYYGVTGHSP